MTHVGLVSWQALLSKVPTGHLYSKEPTQNYIGWNIHAYYMRTDSPRNATI